MTPTFAYYNDNDPFCVEWLKNLVKAGLIPAGEVDGRSIVDVQPEDLAGFRQCHFFAGIGGFALAARMADWPDDMVLWTGGFPCQPYSEAGEQKAENDDRALWPALHSLLAHGRPRFFLGENVRGIIDLGLDRVLDDLEATGYAARPVRLGAFAVDAPHKRERIWICAATDTAGVGRGGRQDLAAWNVDYGTSPGWEQRASWNSLDLQGTHSPWAGSEVVVGPDQKQRRFAAGICPLGYGLSGGLDGSSAVRAKVNKAFGNAVVPQVAAVILREWLRVMP